MSRELLKQLAHQITILTTIMRMPWLNQSSDSSREKMLIFNMAQDNLKVNHQQKMYNILYSIFYHFWRHDGIVRRKVLMFVIHTLISFVTQPSLGHTMWCAKRVQNVYTYYFTVLFYLTN